MTTSAIHRSEALNIYKSTAIETHKNPNNIPKNAPQKLDACEFSDTFAHLNYSITTPIKSLFFNIYTHLYNFFNTIIQKLYNFFNTKEDKPNIKEDKPNQDVELATRKSFTIYSGENITAISEESYFTITDSSPLETDLIPAKPHHKIEESLLANMQKSERRTFICDPVTHDIYQSNHRIEKNTPSLYEFQTEKFYPATHLFSRSSIDIMAS